MKSKVHPTYKTKYRVANWPAYNQALVRRGDVTVWLSSEAIAAWTPRRSGRRGGQRRYSDLAIETALTLRLLYHLPLRQAEGFLHALFGMMRLDLSAPDYTTLSRRSQHLTRCPSRIRCQAATGSWTKSRQWETQRTLFSSARATMCPPAKVNGLWPFNDAWLRTSVVVGQTPGATQRCLNPGFSERIRNSRRTGLLEAS